MPCCKAENYLWCRDLPVVYKDIEGRVYCIFHAPYKIKTGEKEIPVEEFNNLVFERINEAKKKNEPCNLSGTIFERDISFNQFNKDNPLPAIDFERVTFSGETDFINVAFSEDANFFGAEFIGEANFQDSEFKGRAFFFTAKFSKGVIFTEAIFFEEAVFQFSTFDRDVYFRDTTFSKRTNFWITKFNGEAFFKEATFCGEAIFSMSTFSEEANFTEATFHEIADFEKAKFNRRLDFIGKTFIRGGNFRSLYLKEKVRFEGVNFKEVSFIDTDMRRMDFVNCTWPKKLIWGIKPRRDVLYDELALLSDIKDDDEEDKNFFQRLKSRFKGSFSEILKRELSGFKKDISCDKEEIKKVEILYRRLKQKYKEEHNEPEVSNWHYGEKEMYRKGKRLRRIIPFTLSNLYWFSSGYGEGPIRAGVVLFLLVLAISTLLGLTGIKPIDGDSVIKIKGWTDIWNLDYLQATLQYATFEQKPDFIPLSRFLKIAAKLLIPLQTGNHSVTGGNVRIVVNK